MSWIDNAMMWFSDDEGVTWEKVTDHNREQLSVSYERLENKNRMVDGTLRRYSVAKKRTFSTGWSMLPSKRDAVYAGKTGLNTVDGGMAGEDIETFHDENDGSFLVKFRAGQDEAKAIEDGTIAVVRVMITEFSKDIVKRGVVDLWDVNLTMEEV